MPIYIFECGTCESQFEIKCGMSEVSALKPPCPSCKKKKNVYRDFNGIMISVPKTLGSLSDKNGDRMSEDYKTYLHEKNNAYRKKDFTGELPQGTKLFEKDASGNRIPTNKTYKRKKK